MSELLAPFGDSIAHLQALILLLNALLHIVFATGVAKDISNLNKLDIPSRLIPGIAWVLATLIGGILVLVAYWAVHHSTLARKF